MGSLSNNDGGLPNDGGSPDDLPDLPEEWGVIVIPDDLSELADEVRAVRAELQPTLPQTPWQRFAAHPAVRRLRRIAAAGVRAPMMIITIAVLVTVASLFASTWPGPPRSPVTQRTANPVNDRRDTLPALELLGPEGQTVALRGALPAVVMLTEGCRCAQLIADTVSAVRPEIAVLTVTSTTPSADTAPPTGATPQAQGKSVRHLLDPTGGLRTHFDLAAPDGTATTLLVNREGQIVGKYPRTISIEDFRADLARL